MHRVSVCWLLWLIAGLSFSKVSPLAWSDGGHLIVASIAYRQLAPEARTNAAALLRYHPSYTAWAGQAAKTPGVALEEFVFVRASLWADDIRAATHPDRAEHQPDWHYINHPIRPPKFEIEPPIAGELHQAITNCLRALAAPEDTPARKAIALAWLIHLVADLHQPLHNTTLMLPFLRKAGDRGGNGFFVQPGQRPITLHAYWDNLLGTGDSVRTRRNEATRLLAEYPAPEKVEGTPASWSLEACELAIHEVYRKLDLTRGTQAKPASLPEDYHAGAKRTAERQAILAGYRLAELLRAALASPP